MLTLILAFVVLMIFEMGVAILRLLLVVALKLLSLKLVFFFSGE